MNTFAATLNNIATTTRTENGDKAYSTTSNYCLDLFFQVGALRGQKEERIRDLFAAAFVEDRDLATRIALWTRDIRDGAGERMIFRYILKYIENNDIDLLLNILHLVPVVGRWDDLFVVMNNDRSARAVLEMYQQALENKDALAAKWAPRENADPLFAARLRNFLRLTPKQYRKLISGLTKVVEQQMCANEWGEINYPHVPSVASARYSKAFGRHDKDRYSAYIDEVKKGKKKINTAAVYPYDVLKGSVDDKTADAMWKNLPNYVGNANILPMVDVSGSMTFNRITNGLTPLDVSLSLGLYLADRNTGPFKDLCVMFSRIPSLFKIPGGDIRAKARALRAAPWKGQSTNLDAAMTLVLDIAVDNRIPQDDLPKALIVLSDMEFDKSPEGVNSSVSERTKTAFNNAGYTMPMIVWWNIQSRNGSSPIRGNEHNMALVSGFSPAIVKSVLAGDLNPVDIMLRAVNKEKYSW